MKRPGGDEASGELEPEAKLRRLSAEPELEDAGLLHEEADWPLQDQQQVGEVCNFFAKAGWCKFGDGCRFPHVLGEGVEQREPPPGVGLAGQSGEVCQFFSRAGWCKYGDACRHRHEAAVSVVAPGAPVTARGPLSGEICQFFAKAGWCKFGDACRHAHAFPGGAPPAQPRLAPAAAPVVVMVRGAPGAGQVLQTVGEICQFYAKAGWCKFGDACRHLHVVSAGQAPQSPPVAAMTAGLPVRVAFGGAPRAGAAPVGAMPVGSTLPPPSGEICQFFVKSGWCKYGDACRHSHAVARETPPPSGEVCQFFARAGWCKYGDTCRHAHIGPERPPGGTSGEICQFFAKAGWCKFGDACKHSHSPEQ